MTKKTKKVAKRYLVNFTFSNQELLSDVIDRFKVELLKAVSLPLSSKKKVK
jgi:hypothetical protein